MSMKKTEKEGAALIRDKRVAALRSLGHSGAPEAHNRGLLKKLGRYGLVYENTAAKLLDLSKERFRRLVLPEEWIPNPRYSTAPKVPIYDPRTLLEIKRDLVEDPDLAARGRSSVIDARATTDAEIREGYKQFIGRARDWRAQRSEWRWPHGEFGSSSETDFPSSDVQGAKRSISTLETTSRKLAEVEATIGPFDPHNDRDGREHVLANLVRRRGQGEFRRELLRAYRGRCAITDCSVEDVLEAAHIMPYRGEHTNHVCNGLLLRSDLHVLFDLHLIEIDADTYSIIVSPNLVRTPYAAFDGNDLHLPEKESHWPNRESLRLRLTLL
jgi:hypothetical protein